MLLHVIDRFLRFFCFRKESLTHVTYELSTSYAVTFFRVASGEKIKMNNI